jgi:hypothetical protein
MPGDEAADSLDVLHEGGVTKVAATPTTHGLKPFPLRGERYCSLDTATRI